MTNAIGSATSCDSERRPPPEAAAERGSGLQRSPRSSQPVAYSAVTPLIWGQTNWGEGKWVPGP